ncbi:MAG: hypothetical protein V1755_06570 [Chloroflexota bacterium]
MTNEEIHAELKSIRDLLAELKTCHAVQTSACQGHFLRTSNLEDAVYGNGKDGIKDRVRDLETARATIKWVVMAAGITAGVIASTAQAVVQWIK